jgi:uncharacterized membrane protein
LSVIGIATAGYLTWAKLTSTKVVCIGFTGCDIVQESAYAEISGIPVAVVGLLAYIAILATNIMEARGRNTSQLAFYAGFGMSLIGFIYSLYLTYLEAFVIHAFCTYCVVSAVVMTLLFVLSLLRLNIQDTVSQE